MFLTFPFTSMSGLPLPGYTRTPRSFSHPNSHLLCVPSSPFQTQAQICSYHFLQSFKNHFIFLIPSCSQCFFNVFFQQILGNTIILTSFLYLFLYSSVS